MNTPAPPYPTTARLTCLCGKTISGPVTPAASWEQEADLAVSHGWLPVLKGDAVGASGACRYACSPACQTNWLARL
jgi:hypothetical protein